MEEKTKYIIEKSVNQIKTTRIDEQEDGNLTSSSILIDKEGSITLQMQ